MIDRLRILHVIDSGGLYGAEKVVLSLMEEQQRHGHHVELASIAEPGVAEKEIELVAEQAGLQSKRFTFKRGLDMAQTRNLIAYAIEHQISVIHSHGYKANIHLALISSRRRRVAVIATLHGWTAGSYLSKAHFYKLLECALLPRLDGVVAVCHAMTRRKLFSRRLGIKLRHIHNGYDAPVDTPQESGHKVDELRDFIGKRLLVIWIGRLSPEKDCGTAIDAIRHLHDRGQQVCLAIFGEGPNSEELNRHIYAEDLVGTVRMFGYLSELRTVYRLANCLVISSKTEGIPIVLLEAMSSCVPTACTAVGGIPEIIEHEETGLLARPENSLELAEQVSRILTDQTLAARISSNASTKVRNDLSLQNATSQYESMYRSVT